MKKYVWLVMSICFCLTFHSVLFAEDQTAVNPDDKNMYKQLDLMGEALSVIQNKYVDDVSAKDLIYGAINGLLLSLDSYSQFLPPDDYKELLVETEGKFGGVGIEITLRDGLLTVVSPLEDTPAWNAGLKAGDIIVKIDGELTRDITLQQAVKKLRGKPNTKVTITVLRAKDRKLEDITVTRDVIKIKDIKWAVILKDNIAYIRLTEFRESTARDLDKALADLETKGMKALVFDLRNNPGGLLDSAVAVASRFLADDKLVVYTKSRDGEQITYNAFSLQKKYLTIPMVVMINQGSASGSEIVAAGLRENKRAILLGEKSFGKGSVQTVVPLSDKSAVRITTAKYYTPAGNSIHEKGIEPDIVITKEEVDAEGKESEDVFEQFKEEKVEFDYTKDYEILRALDLIKGLMVIADNGK